MLLPSPRGCSTEQGGVWVSVLPCRAVRTCHGTAHQLRPRHLSLAPPLPSVCSSPQLLAAARREVRLLHRCANRHPNLVHLHGVSGCCCCCCCNGRAYVLSHVRLFPPVLAVEASPISYQHPRTAPHRSMLTPPHQSTPHPLPAPQLCHTHPFLLVVTELCAGGDLQSLLHLPEVGLDMRSRYSL